MSINLTAEEIGPEPIHYATYTGKLEMVQWLLANGVAVDTVCQQTDIYPQARLYHVSNWQPMHFAILSDKPEIIHYLLENGADIRAVAQLNEKDVRPIDIAKRFKCKKTLHALKQKLKETQNSNKSKRCIIT